MLDGAIELLDLVVIGQIAGILGLDLSQLDECRDILLLPSDKVLSTLDPDYVIFNRVEQSFLHVSDHLLAFFLILLTSFAQILEQVVIDLIAS